MGSHLLCLTRDTLPADEPMEVGAIQPHPSSQEYEHRWREGICFYCGEKGHHVVIYPNKPPTLTAAKAFYPLSFIRIGQNVRGKDNPLKKYSIFSSFPSNPTAGIQVATKQQNRQSLGRFLFFSPLYHFFLFFRERGEMMTKVSQVIFSCFQCGTLKNLPQFWNHH